MSYEYHKVGSTFRIKFQFPNGVASMTTGKVSGDFLLKIDKNGTGNQATTGCTFAEIDATNNPGMYEYSCSGSTSFVSATGTYGIEVYLSADFTKVWSGSVTVTSDGTGAGSWGDASFTATAANGRVYDGALAVSGATLFITNSAGVLWVKTTSDSSGLWGPVYFNTNGTYTVNVQKSGYTTTSGTIVVTGSTATGPGADLTIAVSSTSSSLLVSTLQGYVRRGMEDRTGTVSDTVILEVINEATELISMERQWEYYHTRGSVSLQAAYSTGTIAVTNGSTTCTLTSGTWPTWAASGELFADNIWVEVETRSSGTVLVLAEPWGNADNATLSYTLGQVRYTLPSDCARISNTLMGQDWPWTRHTSAPFIERLKDQWTVTDPTMTLWAIEKNFLVVWPIPSAVRQVNFLYFRKPTAVSSGSDTLDWDAGQVLLLRRAMDYVMAGRRGADTDEKVQAMRFAKAAYDDALSKAWSWDKTAADPNDNDAGGMGYGDFLRGTVDLS